MYGLQDIDDCGYVRIDKAAHVDSIVVIYGGSVYPPV